MAKSKKSGKTASSAPRSSKTSARSAERITTSSTAEYFSKNLQQVGFSSQTKAVLTTLKEAVDNALDACEENGIIPEIRVEIEKVGRGTLKNADSVRIRVEDNGPGIDPDDVTKVFGEYLASSKFGRGRCSRGQQGIGISAATTWAQLTSAAGARIVTKTSKMRKALSCTVEVDIKNNRGTMKDRQTIDWDRPNGTSVEFLIDGRVQLNGEAGLLSYLNGTALVNPHLTLHYKLPETELVTVPRVSEEMPRIPDATPPHPHTMKLGEFIAHSHLFGRVKVAAWLKKGFSRVHEGVLKDLKKNGIKEAVLNKNVDALSEVDFKNLFTTLQEMPLMAPSTKSVLSIGEESLAKSINRIGEVDFFSVVTRKPTICDFKPVEVEVAIARLKEKRGTDPEAPVQVLRFANRVPLQFDKSACAITQAVMAVNWKPYGLTQPRNQLPIGPYIIAVSVVSPFIKFKNASKETVDSSDELVDEIRRTLIQGGQRLGKHLRKEKKESELEEKLRHIEQFGPMLIQGLVRITGSSEKRKTKAEEGLRKILGRDADATEKELQHAADILKAHQEKQVAAGIMVADALPGDGGDGTDSGSGEPVDEIAIDKLKKKKSKAKGKSKAASKKTTAKSAQSTATV